MVEQAAAGWYPDGQGNERYWDGSSWTEQFRPPNDALLLSSRPSPPSDGAFSRFGAVIKKKATDVKAAKEELRRQHALDAAAAGALVTSGVFGSSTVEIYDGGYVRVASWPAGAAVSTPAQITQDTPYEKLRSIKFTRPSQDTAPGSNSALEGAVGPAVASLIKGGKGLMKASAPGLAVAGIAHIAGAEGRKAYLTLVTDRQIHTLTNQTGKNPLNSIKRAHGDVGLALEEAGNAVLTGGRVPPQETASGSGGPSPSDMGGVGTAQAGPTLAERMRELAGLHVDGILSDAEFSSAKAKLLDGL
jgi:hypothetical protein